MKEELDFIRELEPKLHAKPFAAGIVDLLGFKYQDDLGRMRTVTAATPISLRYEIRSLQHIKVYGFEVVRYNDRAKELRDGK
jgi:hypothetical protein